MSKVTKSTSKSGPVAQSNPSTNVGIDPVPATVNRAPEQWVEPSRVQKKGRRTPREGQVGIASSMADELTENAAAFSEELGPKAPDPVVVAGSLERAHGWASVVDTTSTFLKYARVQNAAAWNEALGHIGVLEPAVTFAVTRDASFAERFPVTTKMVAAQKKGYGRKPKAAKTAAVAAPAAPSTTTEPTVAPPAAAPKPAAS